MPDIFPLPYLDFLCTVSVISASFLGQSPTDFQSAFAMLPADCLARATILSLATDYNGLSRPPEFRTDRARDQLEHLGLRALAWAARTLGIRLDPTAGTSPNHVIFALKEAVTAAWRARLLRPPFPTCT